MVQLHINPKCSCSNTSETHFCSIMDLFFSLAFIFTLTLKDTMVDGATFTFANTCEYTVWPGILDSAGSPKLQTTGFELSKGTTRSFQAPAGWSGRFWARTGCAFDGSGTGTCKTADCGSGQVECNGSGAAPPATLAEFTLGTVGMDFYDVSLVDGYNLPMIVEVSGGSGACGSPGCITDLNQRCPMELKVAGGDACRSACEAFGSPEYCCSGAYNTPATCRPSVYSETFKSACPRSYSYAYDDATSTFTCSGADYTITFCPYSNSRKASREATPATTTDQGSGSMTNTGAVLESGSVPQTQSDLVPTTGTGFESGTQSQSGSGTAMLADGSWLAGLAMGDSSRTVSSSSIIITAMALCIIMVSLL